MNSVLYTSCRRFFQTSPSIVHLIIITNITTIPHSLTSILERKFNQNTRKKIEKKKTLSEAKSTTTSIFAPGESRLDLEEILFQRSFNVEGALEDWASDCDASIDRLKHQFLPLIGNTTNLAFMIRFQCTNFSEMEMKDCSIQKKSEDWFEGNEGCDSSSKELKKLPN